MWHSSPYSQQILTEYGDRRANEVGGLLACAGSGFSPATRQRASAHCKDVL